jgi:hypothetical protein
VIQVPWWETVLFLMAVAAAIWGFASIVGFRTRTLTRKTDQEFSQSYSPSVLLWLLAGQAWAEVTRWLRPSGPRERHRRSDRAPAMAAGEDAVALPRRRAGDPDPRAGAAHLRRAVAGTRMPARSLEAAAAADRSAFPAG